jgi:GT2 family glycosyltransferase
MAVDRRKFLEIGGFDRLYFPAYGEDVDLCIRAKNKGWKSIYVPESVVWHKEGASWKDDGNSRRYFISTKTHLLVQWRHFGGIANEFRRTVYFIHEILCGRKNIHFIKAWFAAKKQWIKRRRKSEIF